ncbi:MAG TPA: isoprenylcysteine carboxylmethyltransferase family protein [Gemmatimonadaceae bacterium]
METLTPDNAGVRFPPPLIYLLVFLAGWAIQRVDPITLLPGGESRVAALVCVVAAVVVFGWAALSLRRHRTSIVPVRPTAALVIEGPYRITRNPLYLGLVLLYAGVAFWLDALWPLVLLPVLVFVIQLYAIRREERYLERRFGEEYRAYTRRVRRWI